MIYKNLPTCLFTYIDKKGVIKQPGTKSYMQLFSARYTNFGAMLENQ
jgi:hypothetical protein